MRIITPHTELRPLSAKDVSHKYVSWLNNREINKYLEARFKYHTIAETKSFVEEMNRNPDIYLFGIFINKQHVGNVKLGPIDRNHLLANIGLLIGETDYWGKGVASEVIQAVVTFAFEELGLQKIDAGCYESNIASKKAFINAGFEVEGFLKSHVVSEGKREGAWLLGITPRAT
ncbi:MAG: N-acetyltransferase [Candidatus Electrothrix sp. AUS1_2]|nr:N-acetyltransferase [Candidatus Electrothrix sp. AUS1_2]